MRAGMFSCHFKNLYKELKMGTAIKMTVADFLKLVKNSHYLSPDFQGGSKRNLADSGSDYLFSEDLRTVVRNNR